MRNQYGIWNQQRWLRSFRTEMFQDKPTPAPLSRQPYADRVKYLGAHATEFYGGRQPQSESAKARVAKSKSSPTKLDKTGKAMPAVEPPVVDNTEAETASTEMVQEGPATRFIKNIDPPLRLYDKNSYSEWRAVVESESDFLTTVPKGDPYRLERDLTVYASGDLRWFAMNADKKILVNQKQRTWLMGADIGVRLRPTRFHQLSAVIEARFANDPAGEDPEDGFGNNAYAKSAYVLVDDLAYNSFFQAGLYRPMFGNYDPDHNSLSSEISGLTQEAVFKGFSVGTAPNVPFVILNYIQPHDKDGGQYESSHGYVVSGGLRFVTMGANATASFWNTEYLGLGQTSESKRQMYTVSAGATYNEFIFNLELLRAQITNNAGAKSAGNVYTLQTKYRFYREMYAVFNYGTANVARDLTPGNGTETMVGLKAFPISNLELETLYIMRKLKEGGVDTSYDLIQFQAHAFF